MKKCAAQNRNTCIALLALGYSQNDRKNEPSRSQLAVEKETQTLQSRTVPLHQKALYTLIPD